MTGTRHSDPRKLLLSTRQEVDDLCAAIRREGRFAFDTEFIGEYSYTPRVWLVQVASHGRLALIDPELVDLTAIWELVVDPAIQTVVFSGQQDFEICTLWMGAPPSNVFDVQVAAGLAGWDYPMSYSRLAAELFNVALKKKETYSDWSRRPLSRAQLDYALEDIRYLLQMHDMLLAALAERGREQWLREEMQTLEDAGNYDPKQTANLAAVKGHKTLTSRQLAVLAELARWREHAAWSCNLPARKFVPDECLIDLARRPPKTSADVLRVRGFPRVQPQVAADAVLEAVRSGLAVPDDRCPVLTDEVEEGNGISLLTDLAVVVGRAACVREHVAHRLFAARRDYEDLARVLTGRTRCPTKAGCRLLAGWRKAFTEAHLSPVIRGQAGVKVCDFPTQPTIAIYSDAPSPTGPEPGRGSGRTGSQW